ADSIECPLGKELVYTLSRWGTRLGRGRSKTLLRRDDAARPPNADRITSHMAPYIFCSLRNPATAHVSNVRNVTPPSAVRSRPTSGSQSGPIGLAVSAARRKARRHHSSNESVSPATTLWANAANAQTARTMIRR